MQLMNRCWQNHENKTDARNFILMIHFAVQYDIN